MIWGKIRTFTATVPCPIDPEQTFRLDLSCDDKKKIVCPKCQNEYEVFLDLEDGESCVMIELVSYPSFKELFEQHFPWVGGEDYLTGIVQQMKDTFVEIIGFVDKDEGEETELNIGSLFDEKRIPPSLYKLLEDRLIIVAMSYDSTIGRVLNMYRNVKKDEVYKELVNLQLKAEQENMIAGGWLPLWKNLAMALGLNLKSLES